MNNAPTNTMLKSDLVFDANVNFAPQNTVQLGAQQNVKKSIKSLGVMGKARHNIDKEVLCVKEVENILRISHSSLYKLLDKQLIKSFHVGRRRLISRTALENFITEQERNNYE